MQAEIKESCPYTKKWEQMWPFWLRVMWMMRADWMKLMGLRFTDILLVH